jgi:hypothetical protein
MGTNVAEGEDMVVLIDLVARDLAAKDTRENIVVVIGHGKSPRM